MMSAMTLQEEGILCEKVNQYPVLFNKQLKRYKEKDVNNAWNAVAKKIKNKKREVFIILSQK